MREIKFRAWDDIEQKFWTLQDGGETSGGGSVQYFGNEQGVLEIGRLEEFDVGLGISSQFTVFPLSQFTGLTDKNGVEIYEGDILQFEHGKGWSNEYQVVSADRWGWGTSEYAFWEMVDRGYTFEVVGNIQEDEGKYLLESSP